MPRIRFSMPILNLLVRSAVFVRLLAPFAPKEKLKPSFGILDTGSIVQSTKTAFYGHNLILRVKNCYGIILVQKKKYTSSQIPKEKRLLSQMPDAFSRKKGKSYFPRHCGMQTLRAYLGARRFQRILPLALICLSLVSCENPHETVHREHEGNICIYRIGYENEIVFFETTDWRKTDNEIIFKRVGKKPADK